MYDQETLQQLRQSWPETTDYLQRVGQVTNDLMMLREMRRVAASSSTWLEQLAVDEEDLLKMPTAVQVLRFLHAREIHVKTVAQVTEYQELRDEHTAAFEAREASTPEILDDPALVLPAAIDARLWALPEIQRKLTRWASDTAARHGRDVPNLSLTQATILLLVTVLLEQEPEQSPEWAEECLLSALSSEFFQQAGTLPR